MAHSDRPHTQDPPSPAPIEIKRRSQPNLSNTQVKPDHTWDILIALYPEDFGLSIAELNSRVACILHIHQTRKSTSPHVGQDLRYPSQAVPDLPMIPNLEEFNSPKKRRSSRSSQLNIFPGIIVTSPLHPLKEIIINGYPDTPDQKHQDLINIYLKKAHKSIPY